MKVFELLTILSKLPAGADIIFHTLIKKDETIEYDGDTDFYELHFENLKIEHLEDDLIQITDK